MTFICPFHHMYYLGHYEINVHIFHLQAKHLHISPCGAVICCALEQMCSPEERMEEKYVGERGPRSSIKNGYSHLKTVNFKTTQKRPL